jgi:LIVCS family branched-chain amino acid:cation transporter
MDLLASILFAVVIWDLLKEKLMVQAHDTSLAEIAAICCMASLIGGTLLGLIYVGLSSVATGNMEVLHAVPKEFMLSALAVQVLGEKLAFVANIAIALACLTTVISLAVTIADVIKVEFDASPLGQRCSLHYGGLTLSIVWLTVVMSNLGFDRLMLYLHPVIALFYPAIIVLTICNILYKLYNFKLVKLPFYITLAGTLGYRLL